MARAKETGPAREVPGEIGIWILIGGDLLVFTLFFVLIALGDREQPGLFAQARAGLDIALGLANTLLLLTGSFLVASAVEHARRGSDAIARRFLCGAMLCGVGFVANKIVEWNQQIDSGLTPMTNDFYMLFYIFTGIHLLHVLLGTTFLAVMYGVCRKRAPGLERHRLIETGGLFWHLVDLLWIVLFALLYLV